MSRISPAGDAHRANESAYRRGHRGRRRFAGLTTLCTAIALTFSGLYAPTAWADPDPSISGRVWANLNGNTTQETNEAGLAGIGVQLVGAGLDGQVDTADDVAFPEQTTDTSGDYAFPGLGAGRYRIQLNSTTVPASKVLTAGTSPLVVDLGAAEQRTVSFGLSDNGSISGKVWSDSNGNGTLDPGEPGTSGAGVTLVGAGTDAAFGSSDDVTFAGASTNGAGDYTFSNLSPDSYRVTLGSVPAGGVLTGAAQNPVTVALSLSQAAGNVNFGFAQTSWLTLAMAPAAVSTFAGSGSNAGVDGTGPGASFKGLQGVAVSGGYAYVASYGSIRKVNLATGAVGTLAGITSGSTTGCVNSTTPASVTFPSTFDVATDGTYVYSAGGSCGVRRTLIATGATSTLASSGSYVTVGPDGFLYVTSGSSVLKVDPVTGASSIFATLPQMNGVASQGWAITSDASALWVAVQANNNGSVNSGIAKVVLADGSASVFLSGTAIGNSINVGVANEFGKAGLASAGDYLYSSSGTNCIGNCSAIYTPLVLRRINKATGAITNAAGTTTAGYADGTGPDAWFAAITGLASDGTSLWIADNGNYRLRRAVVGQPPPSAQPPGQTSTLSMAPATISTFAGSGTNATVDGVGPSASFKSLQGLSISGGFAYVASQGAIRKVDLASGAVTTLAGTSGSSVGCTNSTTPGSVTFQSVFDVATDGTYVYTTGAGCGVRRTSIATGATSTVSPSGSYVTVGPDGFLYATSGSSVLRIDPVNGTSSVFATLPALGGLTAQGYAITSDASALWVAVQTNNNGSVNSGIAKVLLADGSTSVFLSGTAIGNSYNGGLANEFGKAGLASAGDYLYSSSGPNCMGSSCGSIYNTSVLRRIDKITGAIVNIAGTTTRDNVDGTGTEAWFSSLTGLASDGTSLWIADNGNLRLRRAVVGQPFPSSQPAGQTTTLSMAPATISTFAGSGTSATVDGVGPAASFKSLQGLSISGGSAYVGSQGAIRKVSLTNGTVTTLAGNLSGTTGCTNSPTPGSVLFPGTFDVATDGTYVYSAGGSCGVRRTSIATGATSTVTTSGNYVTVGPDGFLYATSGPSVLKIDPVNGTSSVFASLPPIGGLIPQGWAITSDASTLWVAVQTNNNGMANSGIVKILLADGAASVFLAGTAIGNSYNGGQANEFGKSGLASAGDYLYSSSGTNCMGSSCGTLYAPSLLRRINKTTGAIVNVAGTTSRDYVDATGTEAWFSSLTGLASDGTSLWIADNGNLKFRRAVPGQPFPSSQPPGQTTTLSTAPATVSTFAGNGTNATVDGLGLGAGFKGLSGLAVWNGFAYVGSSGALRRVDASTGAVSTLAGDPSGSTTGCTNSSSSGAVTFPSSFDVATDGTYVYSTGCGIRRTSIATGATSTVSPIGSYVTVGPDGFLYATAGSSVLKIDPLNGTATTLATLPLQGDPNVYGAALTSDATALWVLTQTSTDGSYPFYQRHLIRVSLADGSTSVVLDGGRQGWVYGSVNDINLTGIASAGDYLYISGAVNCSYTCTTTAPSQLRRVTKASGAVIDVAGVTSAGYGDGIGPDGLFASIKGIASDGTSLWVADTGNNRLRRAARSPYTPYAPEQAFGVDSYGEIVHGVHVGSGNLVQTFPDVSIDTVGPDLELTRSYNSLDTKTGWFGAGWSSTYEVSASVDPATGDVTITYPNGRRERHLRNPDGSFATPDGFAATLTPRAGGGWDLRQKDHSVTTFDAAGRLSALVDRYGYTLTLTYNGSQLASVADPTAGRALSFTWSAGKIESVSTTPVTGPGYSGQLTWRYVYFGDYLTKVCDATDNDPANGNCTSYEYTDSRLSAVTRPKGNVSLQVGYRADGKVDWVENGVDDRVGFAYATGLTTVTDARQHTSTYRFDAQLRTTQLTDAAGGTTTYGYAGYGFRSSVSDANGNTAILAYDNRGNLLARTDGEGATTWFDYDAGDNLIAQRDARSANATDNTYKTTFTYNASGDKVTETSPPTSEYPAGVTKTWTWTTGGENLGFGPVPAGLLRSSFDGLGTTVYAYDSSGDLRTKTDPSGLVHSYTADALGRVTAETTSWTGGSGTVTVAYDQLGRRLTITEPAVTSTVGGTAVTHQAQTTTDYDPNGNAWRLTVSDIGGSASPTPNRVTTVDFDDADRAWRTTDPEGGVSSKTFDGNGNVRTATDALGRTYRTDYDNADRPTTLTLLGFVDDPLTGSVPRDVVVSRTDYDPAGRVVATYTPRPGTGGRVGQLSPTGTPMVKQRVSYDRADRPTAVVLDGYRNRDGTVRDVTLSATGYDRSGHVLASSAGNATWVVTNTYDQAGLLQTETLELGADDKVTDFDYNPAGQPTRRRVTRGSSMVETRTSYDAAGRMVATTVENGADDLTTTYGYDERGLRTSTVSPRGNASGADPADFRTDRTYDLLGRLVQSQEPAVSVEESGGPPATVRPTSRFGYDAASNQTIAVDPRGAITNRSFDRLNRLTRIDHPAYTPPVGTLLTPYETFSYDPVGNLTAQLDRRGQTTDFSFDARNRVVQQLDPLTDDPPARGATLTTYDDAGLVASTTDPTGAVVRFAADDLGRPRTRTEVVRQPDPTAEYTTTFDYNDLGDRTFVQDASGVSTTTVYDAAGQPITVTDALGKQTQYGYDAAGRRTSEVDPLGRRTERIFDQAGRETSTSAKAPGTGAVLATEYRTYDPDGNQTASRSARSSSATDDTYRTAFAYDALGRLTSVTEPGAAGPAASYGYDAAGNLTRLTDGNGHITTYSWTPWNTKESTVEPSTPGQTALADRTFTTVADAAGLPVSESQPGGLTISRIFDALGRLTTETGAGAGIPTASRTFGYDLAGRRTSFSHPDGTVTLGYDDRGLLLTASQPGSSTTASTFDWDPAGRMTGRTDSNGATTYSYTPRGELDVATDPITGATTNFDWNDAGPPATAAYATSPAPTTRTYTYDGQGRLDTDTLRDSGGATLSGADYDYDPDGNIVAQTITAPGNPAAGLNSYSYDPAGRLDTWTAPGGAVTDYDHDPAGNRIKAGSLNSAFDARNRLLDDGAETYTWTARGTLATTTGPNGTTAVTFDGLGRQTAAGATGYAYDALDRITSRNGTAFAYDGTEIDPTAIGGEQYARTPAGDLLAVATPTGTGFAGENRHGDLAWLLAGNGVVTDSRIWDPYGQAAGTTGSTNPSVGYQGDYTDPASGDVWMGARWYQPDTGTFSSRDTWFGMLSTPISLNRYTYAAGDPLQYFDPDGRAFWDSAAKAVGGAVKTVTNAAGDVWDTTGGKAVSFVNDHVVQPVLSATTATASAVRSAGATVQRTAGSGARFVRRNAKTVVRTGAVIAAAGGTFGACTTASLGFGAVGCGALAGMAGGAVNAAFDCAGHSGADCAKGVVTQAAAGGVAGWAAGAVAVAGGGAALAGGAFGGVHSVSDQLMTTGRVDITQVATETALGAATGVLFEGASARLSNSTKLQAVKGKAQQLWGAARTKLAEQTGGGALFGGRQGVPRTKVTDLADSYPRPPGVGDPRTVAVLDTPSGGSYPGRSGFPGQPHPAVQEALDAVPPGARSPFHGQCAEIHCLTQALEAGDDVAGGTLSTARVRGPNSPAHGTPIPPCPSCQQVLDKLGVGYR